MRQFITQGFLILNTDFPEAFYANLNGQLKEVYQKEGNPGNNLLPRIRELRRVFEHPVVTGALTSVLGSDYLMHAHRHGHYNAVPKAGGWHKDSYWGYRKVRNHHSQWAMIMYFPQDTPLELGPTAVIAGSQYHMKRHFTADDGVKEEALANGSAGTFALIHYDIWHRSTANVLGDPRFMLKFEFMRTQEPTKPEWDCQDTAWSPPADTHPLLAQHEPIWEENWNWLTGKNSSTAGTRLVSADKIQTLATELSSGSEIAALNAAYELAAAGESGIRALLEALDHDSDEVSLTAAYGLSVAGSEAVPGLMRALESERDAVVLHAVFALGELAQHAEQAVPALCQLLSHSAEAVRSGVAEALGIIGTPTDAVVDGLNACLQDDHPQVKFMAGLSIVRLGCEALGTLPYLEQALDDENRYVRAHAIEALRYIGTPEAQQILIDELLDSRWCTTTTAANPFYP